jgi:hypothetical protein
MAITPVIGLSLPSTSPFSVLFVRIRPSVEIPVDSRCAPSDRVPRWDPRDGVLVLESGTESGLWALDWTCTLTVLWMFNLRVAVVVRGQMVFENGLMRSCFFFRSFLSFFLSFFLSLSLSLYIDSPYQ